MALPAAGKVTSSLLGFKSKQIPLQAWNTVTVTGSLEVNIGLFAPLGRTIQSCTVACLGVAAAAGAAYVNVTVGSLPNTVKINVQKSDFTASIIAVPVKFVTMIGSSVGQ